MKENTIQSTYFLDSHASDESNTSSPKFWNEERMLVASLVIGNLIFVGVCFFLFVY